MQFGVSTRQRPSPVSNVNAATLFILSEGSNFSCMEEIRAMLADLFYFTVWTQFFALTDYVIMTSNTINSLYPTFCFFYWLIKLSSHRETHP